MHSPSPPPLVVSLSLPPAMAQNSLVIRAIFHFKYVTSFAKIVVFLLNLFQREWYLERVNSEIENQDENII